MTAQRYVPLTEQASYYQYIPHRIFGAIGQYCGHSVADCKECVKECFKECAETPTDKQDIVSVECVPFR